MALIKKVSRYVDNVKILDEHINTINIKREEIIDDWLSNENIVKIFASLSINIDEFRSIYAFKIFDHFVNVVKKKEEIGVCPPIINFLRYYSSKPIESADLYVLYISLRESTVKVLFSTTMLNAELYHNVCYIFDKNFEGILRVYGSTIFQMEQEIQEYKQVFNQYNAALDQSALVSKTDMNGIITYVNPNFVNISGYTEEELLGNSHNLIRHPDTKSEFFQKLWKTIKNGDTFRGNIKNRKKDGTEYYVDTTILPLYDINKNIKEFLSVRYDVTELIKVRDIAVEAEKSKDIFLANMSHEIRTPLNAIIGFIDILRKRTTDKESKTYLDTIKSSSNSLLTIISDILDFAKLRSGHFDINLVEFNFINELMIVINLFSKNASSKGINYIYKIDSKVPKNIVSDSVRINQILSNFLSNAIKFTPLNGTVTTTIKIENSDLIIAVGDDGEGMNKEQQSRIFHEFEQAEKTTTKKHGGTGLGLAISLKLANYMGGDISLESEPGKGSTFTVTIPIEYDANTLVDMSSESNTDAEVEENEDLEKNQHEGYILVAEDNKANQMLIGIILEEFGLSFEIANDGEEAYKMYEKNKNSDTQKYDLILMDNQMPVMNGVDSSHKIREIEKENHFNKIPIIALTANALKGDREYFLSNGMNDYIKKPIDINELERVFQEYLVN